MDEIVVGAVIENGRYLLVQEGKEKCRGKWNIPAGHLKYNESLLDAVKREVFEETGCDIIPTGILQIGNIVSQSDNFISVVFSTKLINSNIVFDNKEILNAKWFTFEEILNMKDELRIYKWVIDAITNYKENKISDLSLVNIISK